MASNMKTFALILLSILAIHIICWSLIIPFPAWHHTQAHYVAPVLFGTYICGILLHAVALFLEIRGRLVTYLLNIATSQFLVGALAILLLQGGPHQSGSLMALAFASRHITRRRQQVA